METYESEEFIIFRKEETAILLDKISLSYYKLRTKLPIAKIPDNKKIHALVTEMRKDVKNSLSAAGEIHTIYISITNLCNLQCYYCASKIKSDTFITMNNFKLYVMPILEYFVPSRIIITGGEPGTHNDLINIIKLIHSKIGNCRIIIQSNGYNINSVLSEVGNYIYQYNLSCNSYFEDGLSIDELNNTITLNRNKVILSYVLNRRNIDKMYDFLDYAINYDLKIMINFMTPLGCALNLQDLILNNDEKSLSFKNIIKYIQNHSNNDNTLQIVPSFHTIERSCGALGKKLAINADGKISLCQCMFDEDGYVGDCFNDTPGIIENNLIRIINSVRVKSMFEVDCDDICKNCVYRYYCRGLCGAVKKYNSTYEYPCSFIKPLIEFDLFSSSNLVSRKKISELLKFLE